MMAGPGFPLRDSKTSLLPKFSLVPKGADEAGTFTSDSTKCMGCPAGEMPEIAGAQVGQLVLFPVSPEVLYWVEFRRISRKTFHSDFTVQAFQISPHKLAAVCGYPIPDDEEFTFDVTLKVFQEIDYLFGFDRTGVEAKIKVPPRKPGYGRELLPVEVELQDRGLALGTPCTHPVGLLAQADFVDKD